MGKPITTKAGGICSAFPNVCQTPSPTGTVPIPYPSIGQLSSASGTATDVYAGNNLVVIKSSTISSSTGDAAGTGGGVKSGSFGGSVSFKSASGTVFANGTGVVRMFDQTEQNGTNAVGTVLGGLPTVLVGD